MEIAKIKQAIHFSAMILKEFYLKWIDKTQKQPPMMQEIHEYEIDFQQIRDIIYWSKKWEISPYQLMKAFYCTKTCNVKKIESYLRENGFAV